jgi:hypothetical protein
MEVKEKKKNECICQHIAFCPKQVGVNPKETRVGYTKKGTRLQVGLRVNRERRNTGHGSGTLIASLQELLSIANSLEMFHSLRSLSTNWSIQTLTQAQFNKSTIRSKVDVINFISNQR